MESKKNDLAAVTEIIVKHGDGTESHFEGGPCLLVTPKKAITNGNAVDCMALATGAILVVATNYEIPTTVVVESIVNALYRSKELKGSLDDLLELLKRLGVKFHV